MITLMGIFHTITLLLRPVYMVPRVVQGLYREILQTTNLISSKVELLHWLGYRYVNKLVELHLGGREVQETQLTVEPDPRMCSSVIFISLGVHLVKMIHLVSTRGQQLGAERVSFVQIYQTHIRPQAR